MRCISIPVGITELSSCLGIWRLPPSLVAHADDVIESSIEVTLTRSSPAVFPDPRNLEGLLVFERGPYVIGWCFQEFSVRLDYMRLIIVTHAIGAREPLIKVS